MTSTPRHPLVIMIAGRYSADTAAERAANLEALNRAAHQVYLRGHIPVVGVNAALPVASFVDPEASQRLILDLSLALAARCDGCLQLSRSPGADREAEVFRGRGLPVYVSLDQLPEATHAG